MSARPSRHIRPPKRYENEAAAPAVGHTRPSAPPASDAKDGISPDSSPLSSPQSSSSPGPGPSIARMRSDSTSNQSDDPAPKRRKVSDAGSALPAVDAPVVHPTPVRATKAKRASIAGAQEPERLAAAPALEPAEAISDAPQSEHRKATVGAVAVEGTSKSHTSVVSVASVKDPPVATPSRKRPKAVESTAKPSVLPVAKGLPASAALEVVKKPLPPGTRKDAPPPPKSTYQIGLLFGTGGATASTPKPAAKKEQPKARAGEPRSVAPTPPPPAAPVSHEQRMQDLNRRRELERQALESTAKEAFDLLQQAEMSLDFESSDLRPAVHRLQTDTAAVEDLSAVVPLPRLTTFGSVFSLFPRSAPAV